MSDDFISRGFGGKRRGSDQAERIPPGAGVTRFDIEMAKTMEKIS